MKPKLQSTFLLAADDAVADEFLDLLRQTDADGVKILEPDLLD